MGITNKNLNDKLDKKNLKKSKKDLGLEFDADLTGGAVKDKIVGAQ